MKRTIGPQPWNALACIVAGLLFPIYTLLHPTDDSPAAILNSPWVAIHSLWFVGTLLTLVGLLGVYARQSEEDGRLGMLGFALLFAGTLLSLGVIFFDSYIVPLLAASAPALLDRQGPLMAAPVLVVAGLSSFVLVAVGYILFGIATMRAGALPRWSGLLLAIGGPLFPVGQVLGPIMGVIGAAIFGAGPAHALFPPADVNR